MERKHTLPARKTVTATIKVVVGMPPFRKGEDNLRTVITELVLNDLTRRPRGVTLIRVTFDVKHGGETQIVAEELMGDGDMINCIIDLPKHLHEVSRFHESYHDDAVESEARWARKGVRGDLPELV